MYYSLITYLPSPFNRYALTFRLIQYILKHLQKQNLIHNNQGNFSSRYNVSRIIVNRELSMSVYHPQLI